MQVAATVDPELEAKPQESESRYADACKLPRKRWIAMPHVVSKYDRSNRPVGAVYDSSAVLWMRRKGHSVPAPRSEFKAHWMFNNQFFNYWEDSKPNWDSAAFAYAERALRRSYRSLGGLKLAELDDVAMSIVLDPDKKDKSAGLPNLDHKNEAMDYSVGMAKAIATGRVAPPPNIAFHKTSEAKVRLVWGYPLSVLLLEGRIMLPIEAAFREGEFPYVLGYTSSGLQGRLARLGYSNVQYCLDWSKYDSTMPARVIHTVFRLIRSWFGDVDETLWDVVVRYFVTCPVVMPDEYLYSGRKKGIPSGSWFTQLIGSLCNEFLIRYLAFQTGDHVGDALFMGDDAVLGMERMPSVQKWSELASRFGMVIHPTKQVVTHGAPHFLMHTWGGCWPTRPVGESLQRLATSERYKRFSSREEYLAWTLDKAKGLLVDNPAAFEELSDYVAWRMRIPVWEARRALNAGRLNIGSWSRRGWAEADSTVPTGKTREGFKRSLGQQILCH